MTQKVLLGLLTGSVILFSGCTHRMGQFTAASSKHVQNLNYNSDTKTAVEGEECNHIYIIIPVGKSDDMIQRAMDNTIDEANKRGIKGSLLVDTRIDFSSWYIPYIYGKTCVKVKGDLVQLQVTK